MDRRRSPSILVQCIGNRLRQDDGAGPAVADRLRDADLPEQVQVQEHWGEGSELMRHWHAADQVILVDAAYSGAPAGQYWHLDAHRDPIPRDLCYRGTHRFGVVEAVETARALGQLPPALTLWAIEGEAFAWGEGLSPAVEAAVARVAEAIRRQITVP